MTETWPPPKFIELYTRRDIAEMLRELWEKRGPRVGDWFLSSTSGISGIAWWEDPIRSVEEERAEPANQDGVFWLPRLDQLIEMLEGRGYSIRLFVNVPTQLRKPEEENSEFGMCDASIWRRDVPMKYGDDFIEIETVAPDPASALLLALVEVMDEER